MPDTETVDHQARRDAALALQKLADHEDFCKERTRRAEIFETEMRVGIKDIENGFRTGLGRIHGRLDAFSRGALVALATGVLSAVGTAIWWLITTKGA